MKLFSFRIRAISVFTFDTGMSTRRCFDPQALRIRVSISAIGSVMLMSWSLFPIVSLGPALRAHETCRNESETFGTYQLAFRTPGIIPESDRSRKQIRQMPNLRR